VTRGRAALAVVAATAALAQARPARAAGEREWRGLAVIAPYAVVDYITDGHGLSNKDAAAIGLEGEVWWRARHVVRLGVGLGTRAWLGGATGPYVAQDLSAVGLVGAHVGLAGRQSLDLDFGLGGVLAAYPDGGTHSGPVLLGSGWMAELGVSWSLPLDARRALVVGVSARYAEMRLQNGTDYFSNARGTHGLLGVRVGLRWP
jgi:hypothetical protein